MKLYNKTKCPDKLLYKLLATAGKSVGAIELAIDFYQVVQHEWSHIKDMQG
jgi:hypothetical protein